MLAWVYRAAKAAELVDHVWFAIPSKDTELAKYLTDHALGDNCWCGSELDVLRRFKEAASASKADIVVRLTADCPFLDPWLIDQCIEHHCDSTENWPDGMDVQVFRPHMLEFGDTEHVVSPKWVRPQLPCPKGSLRHVRVTLDTPQDLLDLRAIAAVLPANRAPTWRETLAAVRSLKGTFRAGKEADPPRLPDVLEGVQPVAG